MCMYIMGVKWNRLPNKYQTYIQCVYIYIFVRVCVRVCVYVIKTRKNPQKMELISGKIIELNSGFPEHGPSIFKTRGFP